MQKKKPTNGYNEEVTEELQEDLDFTKPNFEFIPKGSHAYTQRGPYLVCKSCDLDHAVYIGMEKIMTGISSDGQPILKERGEIYGR